MTKSEFNPDETILGVSRMDLFEQKNKIASFIVIKGRELGRVYQLRSALDTIGRDNSATITLLGDPLISRKHASVSSVINPGSKQKEYFVSDLKSTNHTYVNGEQITMSSLQSGDKVKLGETIVKFVIQDEIDAKYQKEIQRRLNYDNLTGLLTRESFELAMKSKLEQLKTHELSLAQLMMDIDFFKKVNDAYGHMTGSFVLAEVGKLIHQSLRSMDVSGRYGGEEFIAFLPEVDDLTAFEVAERLRANIKSHDFVTGQNLIKITISIGISIYPFHGITVAELIHSADIAMYSAKKAGRDKVVFYTPDLQMSP